MTYEILKSVSDLVGIAGKLPGATVLIPGGDRVEDLQLVDAACDYGIITSAILVGSQKNIIENAEKVGINIDGHKIVDVDSDQQISLRAAVRAGLSLTAQSHFFSGFDFIRFAVKIYELIIIKFLIQKSTKILQKFFA